MPCKRVALSTGALWGNMGGGELICQDILREKKNYIQVPFLDPEDIKILSLGAI
jgi:hypothetical protein